MDIEIYVLILIAIITLLASFIQSTTGFGFGIIAMIFLPLLLSFTEANGLSAILSTLTSVVAVCVFFKKTNWKNLIFPLIGSIVFNYVAISLVKSLNNDVLTLLLGIALLLLSIFFFFFSNKIKIRPTWYSGLIAGAISGILSGIFSIGGPPIVIYYIQSEKDKDTYMATISMFFVLSGISSITMKAFSGFITVNVLIALGASLIAMVIGSLLGKLVRNKANANLLKKMVYGVMAISGITNIITSLI